MEKLLDLLKYIKLRFPPKPLRTNPYQKTRLYFSSTTERGATLVEFAIILPLFFLLIFGIIEFSILLYDKAILTNASREGARLGSLYYHQKGANNVYDDPKQPGATTNDDFFYNFKDTIKDKVFIYCQNSLISFGADSEFEKDDIVVTWYSLDTGDEILVDDESDMKLIKTGDTLSVLVPYNFKFLVFSNLIKLIGGSFQNGIPLEAETVMRVE